MSDAIARSLPATLKANDQLHRWVDFHPDGTVAIRSGKVELGQGIVSAIAQIAADELDVDYSRIRPQPMDTRISPNEGSTTGSRSLEEGGEGMRQACAEIRRLFVLAAASQLGVPADQVRVKDGQFSAPAATQRLTYWELTAQVDLHQPAPALAAPKAAADLTQVGHALPRLDIERKLRGSGFIQDLAPAGMLHGRIVRPPALRARLLEIDEAPCRALPGVRAIVRRGSFLGVVAEREEQAIRAMQVLARHCRWTQEALLPDADQLPDYLCAQEAEIEILSDVQREAPAHGPALTATFTRPYIAHGSIGPSCALACWTDDSHLEFWSHTQSLYALRDEICRTLHLPPAQVIAHHAEGAGCYGHNGADDAAFDAVLLARAVPGSPVRVQWMREDEFAWEPLGPTMVVKLSGTLTPDGRVGTWDQHIYGNRHISRPGRRPQIGLLAAWHFDEGMEPPPPADMPLHMGGGSQRNAVPYYDFPTKKVTNHAVLPMPVRTSALRALGAHLSVYAIESFMDEMATAAGVDPIEFRRRHLSDPRALAVIDAVSRRAGWTPGQAAGSGRGRGFAFARYKNMSTYVAIVAEVDLTSSVRVTRVVAAVECGRIVNPDGLMNQCEGGVVQAISWTLKEQMRFDRERITTLNWEDYPILSFSEVPQIDIELINRPDLDMVGAGEGMVGPTGAAIGNAIFHALGVRVRDMPLSFDRIAAAMDAP